MRRAIDPRRRFSQVEFSRRLPFALSDSTQSHSKQVRVPQHISYMREPQSGQRALMRSYQEVQSRLGIVVHRLVESDWKEVGIQLDIVWTRGRDGRPGRG
jgi:hypothetical protein